MIIKANELSNFVVHSWYKEQFAEEYKKQLCYVLSTEINVLPEVEQIKG